MIGFRLWRHHVLSNLSRSSLPLSVWVQIERSKAEFKDASSSLYPNRARYHPWLRTGSTSQELTGGDVFAPLPPSRRRSLLPEPPFDSSSRTQTGCKISRSRSLSSFISSWESVQCGLCLSGCKSALPGTSFVPMVATDSPGTGSVSKPSAFPVRILNAPIFFREQRISKAASTPGFRRLRSNPRRTNSSRLSIIAHKQQYRQPLPSVDFTCLFRQNINITGVKIAEERSLSVFQSDSGSSLI